MTDHKVSFFRAAILSAATFLMGPQAVADTSSQNRGGTSVEMQGVDCNPEDGQGIRVLMSSYFDTQARVTFTDINGRVHQVSEDVRVMETLEGLNRSQLEQLANTASADEGQNVYRQALDEVVRTEQYCQAQSGQAPKAP